MRLKTSDFIEKHCKKAGISRGDKRLDFQTIDTFKASLAAAALEDRGLSLFEQEEDLRQKQLDLEAREAGLAGSTTTGVPTGKAAEIEAKKAELARLKGKGSTGQAQVLIREIEALEEVK